MNESRANNWYFVTADDLEYFFHRHMPARSFVVFSSGSDRPLDRPVKRFFRAPELQRVFATNVVTRHPKLTPIPLGIRNPHPADHEVFRHVQNRPLGKSSLFHVQFSVEKNSLDRSYCLDQIGLELGPRTSWDDYLVDLAQSYFCISPKGRGIDCHRTWEALYLGTIPVVTRSAVTDQHGDLPMIVLDDWSQFRSIDFSPELFRSVWGAWSADELQVDRYLSHLQQRYLDGA